jgi:hypothetical protein
MEIIFEKDIEIMGEPGPNLLFKGETKDFLKFLNLIHPLGKDTYCIIKLISGDHCIKLLNFKSLTMQSSSDGNTLLSKKNGDILINLNYKLWVLIISKFLLASFSSGHQYIEFDNLNLISDANILLSSSNNQ